MGNFRLSRRHILEILSASGLALLSNVSQAKIIAPIVFRTDDVGDRLAERLASGSHIKIFIPSLPYVYTAHSMSAGFTRPANNAQGWEYDLAERHEQLSPTHYRIYLRKNVKFQDGTDFNADAVMLNLKHFKVKPFLFTKLDQVFDYGKKINNYTVDIHLKEEYGQLINDFLWLHLYTAPYLKKFGWNGKPFCPNLAEAGPYSAGPFILSKGYVEGDRSTPEIEMVANPYYWRKNEPKVAKITIYTALSTDEVLQEILKEEGSLDIAPIPYEAKIETILSDYGKVVSTPSNNNIAIHMNMRNGNKQLMDVTVRRALNQAIDQQALLDFVYDGEGQVKPTVAAPSFPGVHQAVLKMKAYSEIADPKDPMVQKKLKAKLDGLVLRVLTQERFMFLWRGIEYQLGRVGVKLEFDIVTAESEVFAQLLTTNGGTNTKQWDLLSWGMDDWYYNHPWSVFLVYRTTSAWSTIMPDPNLDKMVNDLFTKSAGTTAFNDVTYSIMQHVYDQAYMLFVPAPNQVMALNKEVSFMPYKMAVMPTWDMAVSSSHWSVRSGEYPKQLKSPVDIVRSVKS